MDELPDESTSGSLAEYQKVVVIHRDENGHPKQRADTTDRIIKIVATVVIPCVVAWVGWLVKDAVSDRNVSLEFVKLSVSVLTKGESVAVPELRKWAVELLNEYSSVKLPEELSKGLENGTVTLLECPP